MSKTKILIVEDEKLIALELTKRLEQIGYEVCNNVSNAIDAFKEIERCIPDIILMDIYIEGEIDGIDLAKKIRECKNIPIIYITAYSDSDTLNRAKETLPYGYLVKPISDRDLRIKLDIASYRIKIEKELEKTKRELIESEFKYKTVANHTYDWEYWIHNNSIKYISPSVERITGYSTEEFINTPSLIENIIYNDDKKLWLNHYLNRKRCQEPMITEFRIVTKNGAVVWLEHICRNIHDENGNDLGLRISNRDITLQKELELKLISNTIEVQESERNRYSRELHDGLGPLLAIIKLYFQWLSEPNDTEKLKKIIEKGLLTTEKAIETTRQISRALCPLQVENDGFVNAFQCFIDDLNISNDVSFTFTSNISQRLNRIIELTLYRISTELVNNSLKYSYAKVIAVSCDYDLVRNVVNLTYFDNGKGFNIEEKVRTSNGIGLPNINSRVKALGGKFVMESGKGKGTKAIIELPNIEI